MTFFNSVHFQSLFFCFSVLNKIASSSIFSAVKLSFPSFAVSSFSTSSSSSSSQPYSENSAPLTLDQVRQALASLPVQATARPPLLFRSLAIDERLPMWINNEDPTLTLSRQQRGVAEEARHLWTETGNNYFTLFGQFGMVKARMPLVSIFNPFTREVELSPHPTAHALQPSKRLREHQQALLGTMTTKLHNSVNGCMFRYKRLLKLVGMGYRIASVGPHPKYPDQRVVEFQLGRSHLIPFALPASVQIKVLTKRGTVFRLLSTDYEALQRTAMSIRFLKEPETYTGKGVVFWGENVVKKEGKKK